MPEPQPLNFLQAVRLLINAILAALARTRLEQGSQDIRGMGPPFPGNNGPENLHGGAINCHLDVGYTAIKSVPSVGTDSNSVF